VIDSGSIGNPGSSWHVNATGDFNGDGFADILWQNDDGSVGIWEMNGTNIIGGGIIATNPGPSWHVIGTGDYNGEGRPDILLQNDNGQAAIWLMSGTTPTLQTALEPNLGVGWHLQAG